MCAENRLKDFAKDENGTIAILWAMSLLIFLGFAALIFDIGRGTSTQTDLQTFADHVALAAAGELNGQSGAINRATAAGNNLLRDTQTFGEGVRQLGPTDLSYRFFTSLPTADTTAVPASMIVDITKNGADEAARYVEVTVADRAVVMPFTSALRGLLGRTANAGQNVGAIAVASSTLYKCDVTPLFFCAPPGRKLTSDAEIGTMVRLRSGGSGSPWLAGNFGFLDIDQAVDKNGVCAAFINPNQDNSNNSQLIQCLLGAELGKTACVPENNMGLNPGQAVGVMNEPFNFRFDMFKANDSRRNDYNFRPAPNVINGIVPGANGCSKQNEEISTQTVHLMPDYALSDAGNGGNCNGNADCPKFSPTSGSANWSGTVHANIDVLGTPRTGTLRDIYMDINHPGIPMGPERDAFFSHKLTYDDIKGFADAPENGAIKVSQLEGTRFDTYLREILYLRNELPGYSSALPGDRLLHATKALDGTYVPPVETGIAQCHQAAGNPATDDKHLVNPFRRVVTAAMIDCDLDDGTKYSGNADNVPAEDFVRVFLTEPVGLNTYAGNNFDIWGEIIGDAGNRGSTIDAGGITQIVIRLVR